MYWCKNLAGSQVLTKCEEGSMPWDFDLDSMVALHGQPLITGLMKDKKARSNFMTAPDSEWNVYICSEGLDPYRRPSKDNPVVSISALVGDFDITLTEDFMKKAAALKLPPNWIEQSLSGNFRAIWLFERPLGVTGPKHAKAILEKLGGLVKIKKIAPALDDNSFNPSQTWTNGGRWAKVGEKPLATELLTGTAIECLKGLKGDGLETGTVTDLKAMAEALAEKFPKFRDWPGEFALESQGPSFWIEASQSPKSAIVKPWGMFTFADMAPKAAYSWKELVGKDVADSIVAKKMSDAVGDVYYDGQRYFIQNERHEWHAYGVDPIRRYLKIQHGLTSVAEPGGTSQVDEALNSAEMVNKVNAAAPCIPFDSGLLVYPETRKTYLNTWNDGSVKPADQPVTDSSMWPHIAEHLEHIFTHPDIQEDDQLTRFLDWLSVFYYSIHKHRPIPGQVVFVMGPVSVGKGMLSGIVGQLVGGKTRAEELLTGKSSFGGETYDCPLMCVDDLGGMTTRQEVNKFTDNLKARVANASSQFHHKKHQTPDSIPWFGRVMVTLNDDDQSMSVMPDFSSSVEDKISLFHAAPTPSKFANMFADQLTKEKIIAKEAPFFAKYLLQHYENIPQERKHARYGVQAYHAPTLRAEVEDTQSLGTLQDPLCEWAQEWFAANQKSDFWEGKASQLFRELQMGNYIGPGTAFSHANAKQLGRQLRRELKSNPAALEAIRSYAKTAVVWRIKRKFVEGSKQ